MIIKNKKATGIVVGAFGIIAIISTGFAGWTIGFTAEGGGSGGFTVDSTVTSAITDVTGRWDDWQSESDQGGHVVYAPKDASTGTWFKGSGSTFASLVRKYTATVTHVSGISIQVSGLTVVEDYVGESKTETTGYYYLAKQANYVGELPAIANSRLGCEVSDDNSSWTSLALNTAHVTTGTTTYFRFTATFVWGSLFGGQNPVDYFNGTNKDAKPSESSPTYGEIARKLDGTDAANSAYKNLENAKFILSFSLAKS